MECLLCKRENLTRKFPYFEDGMVWITDDLHKRGYKYRILAVLKKHVKEPNREDAVYVEACLRRIANSVIGIGKYDIDWECKTIPEHWHLQANSKERL